MKKFFSLFLVLMMCFSLVGCGDNENNTDKSVEDKKTDEKEENEKTAITAEEDLILQFEDIDSKLIFKKSDLRVSLQNNNIETYDQLKFSHAMDGDGKSTNNKYLDVCYGINNILTCNFIFNKETNALYRVQIIDSSCSIQPHDISFAMVYVLDDYDNYSLETIADMRTLLEVDETGTYVYKDKSFTVDLLKSDTVNSYELTINKNE